MDGIPTLADLYPPAHLVTGTMSDEATALRWLEALIILLQRLNLGVHGFAFESQHSSWGVRCAFAAEADAIKVAEAVRASAVGRPSVAWTSEREFEADDTRLAGLVATFQAAE
jgi:hypothetical protein